MSSSYQRLWKRKIPYKKRQKRRLLAKQTINTSMLGTYLYEQHNVGRVLLLEAEITNLKKEVSQAKESDPVKPTPSAPKRSIVPRVSPSIYLSNDIP